MKHKMILFTAAAAGLTMAAPAQATWWKHTHYCHCGHSQGGSACGSTTTTSGGTTTTSGGTTTTSGGTTTTSGGTTTTTSGGTAVPEPGVLGLFGLGLLGLGLARRRRRR